LTTGIPMTALIRQLPRLTRLGVARDRRAQIARQLTDPDRLRKARIHPVNVLVAQRTYASGRSARGESTWTPDRMIVDALDAAFYASFGTVEPTGKRTLLALDVSGSMAGAAISNLPLTAREASAALALVTAATEPDYDIVGFTAAGDGWNIGGCGRVDRTDDQPTATARRRHRCSVRAAVRRYRLRFADGPRLETGRKYDTFVIYTDNETWAGAIHPHQALQEYRRHTGIDARLVVVGMTATKFSIADPSDPGMLDVVGFDSAVPQLIADFSRGW
jgi:60 kDa SS-A/Ro ribonucleoprotein